MDKQNELLQSPNIDGYNSVDVASQNTGDKILADLLSKLEDILNMDEGKVNSGPSNQRIYNLFLSLFLATGNKVNALSVFNPITKKEKENMPIQVEQNELGNLIDIKTIQGNTHFTVKDKYDKEIATIVFLKDNLTITTPGDEDNEISTQLDKKFIDSQFILNTKSAEEDYSTSYGYINKELENLDSFNLRKSLLIDLINPILCNIIYTLGHERKASTETIKYILDFDINDGKIREILFNIINKNTDFQIGLEEIIGEDLLKVLNDKTKIEDIVKIAKETSSRMVLDNIFELWVKNNNIDESSIIDIVRSLLKNENTSSSIISGLSHMKIVVESEEFIGLILSHENTSIHTIYRLPKLEIVKLSAKLTALSKKAITRVLKDENTEVGYISELLDLEIIKESEELIGLVLKHKNTGAYDISELSSLEIVQKSEKFKIPLNEAITRILKDENTNAYDISRLSKLEIVQGSEEFTKLLNEAITRILKDENTNAYDISKLSELEIVKGSQELIGLVLAHENTSETIHDNMKNLMETIRKNASVLDSEFESIPEKSIQQTLYEPKIEDRINDVNKGEYVRKLLNKNEEKGIGR